MHFWTFFFKTFLPPFPNDDVLLVKQVGDVDADDDRIDLSLYDELDKENQRTASTSITASTSKCRRGLFGATDPNLPNEMNGLDLEQQQEYNIETVPDASEIYSYATGCRQPHICLALLGNLQMPDHQFYYRSAATSTTGTISTNTSSTPGRPPLMQANISTPPPYRTVSHFGFISPRQPPRLEHKHLPLVVQPSTAYNAYYYRPMQRAISYEEIFSTPRYEKLCQPCFDHLLRLKPEIRRITASAPASSSEDDVASGSGSGSGSGGSGSGSDGSRKLPTLPELDDELAAADDSFNYERLLQHQAQPPGLNPMSTQTFTSSGPNFINLIERFNFSEESADINYEPNQHGVTSDFSLGDHSQAASPTSGHPAPSSGAPIANITEIWDFGNWQEKENEFDQQPLTERRITFEITQFFGTQEQPNTNRTTSRPLMHRDERQQRKTEFQELWEDHLEYFEAKEQMESEVSPLKVENTVQIPLDESEIKSLLNKQDPEEDDEENQEQVAEGGIPSIESSLTEPKEVVDVLPQMLQEFEESLSRAGQNLGRLVETTRKLHACLDTTPEPEEENQECSIFRSITFENLSNTNDAAALTVERSQPLNSLFDDIDAIEAEVTDSDHPDYEEKHDDEKPVTPSSMRTEESTTEKEKDHVGEKDVDEVECPTSTNVPETDTASHHDEMATASTTTQEPLTNDSDIFSPLEREILQRIESDNLKEVDEIFGKIDHSIRNKITPSKLDNLINEETFTTCTHIYSPPDGDKTPCPPPSSSLSSLSMMHNISAPCSPAAHTHVIIRQVPRLAAASTSSPRPNSRSSSTSSKVESLERSISSTTFVYSSNPRKRRNFVQENIRNAFKPRSGVTRPNQRKLKPAVHSDTSSLCAFQSGQRDSGARLWVSLPTPPRPKTSPHRHLYTSPRTPSPYAIRRKPPGHQLARQCGGGFISTPCTSSASLDCSLHRTLSSSTFLIGLDEPAELENYVRDSFSTETFEFDFNNESNVEISEEEQVEDETVRPEEDEAEEECTAERTSDDYVLNTEEAVAESSYAEEEPSTNQDSHKGTEEDEQTDQQLNEDENVKFHSQVVSQMENSLNINPIESESETNIPVINFNLETAQEATVQGTSSLTEQNSYQITINEEIVETENSIELQRSYSSSEEMFADDIKEKTSRREEMRRNHDTGEGDEIWKVKPERIESGENVNENKSSTGESNNLERSQEDENDQDEDDEDNSEEPKVTTSDSFENRELPSENSRNSHENLNDAEEREVAGGHNFIEDSTDDDVAPAVPGSPVKVNSSGYSLTSVGGAFCIRSTRPVRKSIDDNDDSDSMDDTPYEKLICVTDAQNTNNTQDDTQNASTSRSKGGAEDAQMDDHANAVQEDEIVLNTCCTLTNETTLYVMEEPSLDEIQTPRLGENIEDAVVPDLHCVFPDSSYYQEFEDDVLYHDHMMYSSNSTIYDEDEDEDDIQFSPQPGYIIDDDFNDMPVAPSTPDELILVIRPNDYIQQMNSIPMADNNQIMPYASTDDDLDDLHLTASFFCSDVEDIELEAFNIDISNVQIDSLIPTLSNGLQEDFEIREFNVAPNAKQEVELKVTGESFQEELSGEFKNEIYGNDKQLKDAAISNDNLYFEPSKGEDDKNLKNFSLCNINDPEILRNVDYLSDSLINGDLICDLGDIKLTTYTQQLEDRISDINEMIMEETMIGNKTDDQAMGLDTYHNHLNEMGQLKRKNTTASDIDIGEPVSQKSKESLQTDEKNLF
ncbi:uncharacterized protein LOC124459919 [Drosophila willistoni]|uniref:uncharacterized protein LOC124459919 n=1 Tax=Drosophila willistoni TaxID=7260 RepID=UPI001F08156F|nr:uncharacterized protein LOC124459919 [Drosophila willistoni]